MKKILVLLGLVMVSVVHAGSVWIIDSQMDWNDSTKTQTGLEVTNGLVSPTAKTATFQSTIKSFPEKCGAASITISQSPVWKNWESTGKIGPRNLRDAPVFLRRGDKDYWVFARYGGAPKKAEKGKKPAKAVGAPAKLEGFVIPLQTTADPNQYVAPGGLKNGKGGYHAWQSRDMVNWVYHGPVTPGHAGWVTTAEFVDGKAYIYYDYPNDQDPHLVIDEDLTDGKPGKDMGMAFKDPSHGSDCAVIRDLGGNFHMILEDWSPLDASTHAWDSPLAMHAVSPDGIGDFKILPPPVDERTTPTGKSAEYFHPHWYKTDPDNFPGKPVPADIPQHRIKAGDIRAAAQYEIHEPEQNAYGDWAAIAIGGQYYLFCDFDPAVGHGKPSMSVAWFTASSINEPFTFCGNIGKGHPDPDIMFVEGTFYLITQTPQDFVSPGPWVEGVEVRVGVDTDKDGAIDRWTDWQTIKERYEAIPSFAKQVAKTPATLDLSELPAGYGFQFELELTDTTGNPSKPILDKVNFSFNK